MQDLEAPPDRPKPSDDVQGRQHLKQAKEELALVEVSRVADACSKHGTRPRQHYAQHGNDVGPGAFKTRYIRCNQPDFFILLAIRRRCPPTILDGSGCHATCILRGTIILLLLMSGLHSSHDNAIRSLRLLPICTLIIYLLLILVHLILNFQINYKI